MISLVPAMTDTYPDCRPLLVISSEIWTLRMKLKRGKEATMLHEVSALAEMKSSREWLIVPLGKRMVRLWHQRAGTIARLSRCIGEKKIELSRRVGTCTKRRHLVFRSQFSGKDFVENTAVTVMRTDRWRWQTSHSFGVWFVKQFTAKRVKVVRFLTICDRKCERAPATQSNAANEWNIFNFSFSTGGRRHEKPSLNIQMKWNLICQAKAFL